MANTKIEDIVAVMADDIAEYLERLPVEEREERLEAARIFMSQLDEEPTHVASADIHTTSQDTVHTPLTFRPVLA